MKLGLISRITNESLGNAKDVPKWFQMSLVVLNDFIEKVGKALLGNLTFADNFYCKTVTQEFESGVEAEVSPRRNPGDSVRASGVLPLNCGGLTLDKFKWQRKDNGNVGVTFTFDGGGTATCSILILLE
jgi:hypothetical protein